MTSKQIDRLAEKIVNAVMALQERKRAQKKAATAKRKANSARRAIDTLGTTKFKPMNGLYPEVAGELGCTREHVYQVAKGLRKSPRVIKALREEVLRRTLATTVTAPTNSEGASK